MPSRQSASTMITISGRISTKTSNAPSQGVALPLPIRISAFDNLDACRAAYGSCLIGTIICDHEHSAAPGNLCFDVAQRRSNVSFHRVPVSTPRRGRENPLCRRSAPWCSVGGGVAAAIASTKNQATGKATRTDRDARKIDRRITICHCRSSRDFH